MSSAHPEPAGPDGPAASAPGAAEAERLRSARRDMALESLLELGRELNVALDLFETADLLLFNLMGQLGTACAALWLQPEPAGDAEPVLVRTHGFRRPLLEAVGANCVPALRARFATDPAPFLSWALSDHVDAHEFTLLQHAGIAMFAPLQARGQLLGWLALGARLDGSAYSEDEIGVLRAMLGLAAVSFQNAQLYNRERETTRQLRSANEHLRELDRLKTEFLANVNHELRTPLAVVIATLDVVRGQVEPRIANLLEASHDQSLRLKDLIENLLSFSEAKDDRLALDVEPADLGALATRLHGERHPGVSAGFRELSVSVRPGLPPVKFDPHRAAEIVNELIDNAVKFTPAGTRIEIRCDRFADGDGDWIGIEVADGGPGMPADQGAMMLPFRQGDGSSTRTAGGLGMGLARCRALAERLHGRVVVDSRPGAGCRVRFLLPAA